ncbi:MAG: HAD family hydrolase [Moheibacter sp.]
MKYKNIIFNLDGTLWDSRESLIENWNQVLKDQNLLKAKLVPDDMNQYMGLLIQDVLKDLFPTITENQVQEILTKIEQSENESIQKHGGVLYPNVKETLERLNQTHNLFIVSNCQNGYIEAFLEYYNFQPLFTDFESHGRTNKNKATNIQLLLNRNKLKNKETVYVGDTETDYQSTIVNDLDFIYCSYGFGEISHNLSIPHLQNFNELIDLMK